MKKIDSVVSVGSALVLIGVLLLCMMAIATHARHQAEQLDEQAPRLERRDVYCRQIQFQAALTRDNLRSADKATRDGAREQFKILALGGWSMANMCSAVHVGVTCDDDDLSCQLAALDWALINIQ